MLHYGTSTPPQYDLGAIPSSLPIAIFSGGLDYLADPTDVERLLAELPSGNVIYHNNQPDYAHLDFTWAENAGKRIYGEVSKLLKVYATKK